MHAAKKAISKMPVRTIKSGDRVSLSECILNIQCMLLVGIGGKGHYCGVGCKHGQPQTSKLWVQILPSLVLLFYFVIIRDQAAHLAICLLLMYIFTKNNKKLIVGEFPATHKRTSILNNLTIINIQIMCSTSFVVIIFSLSSALFTVCQLTDPLIYIFWLFLSSSLLYKIGFYLVSFCQT